MRMIRSLIVAGLCLAVMARQIALLFVIGVFAYACFWAAWRWF